MIIPILLKSNEFLYFRINYQKHIPTKDIAGKFCPMVKPEESEAMKKELTGICLFVTSTFGNGDPPRTGEPLAEWLDFQMTKMEVFQHDRMVRSSSYDIEEMDQPENISGLGKTLNRRIAMTEKHVLGDLR